MLIAIESYHKNKGQGMEDNKTDKNNKKQSLVIEAKDVRELKRIKQKESFVQSLKNGSTHIEAAKAAGIGETSIWNWRQDDKDFAKACESALESRIKIVEDALFLSATGKEGKAKIIAQIFWLKNRGHNWKDKQDITFIAPKEVKQNTFIQAGEEPVIEEEAQEEAPGDTQDEKKPVTDTKPQE